MWVKMVRWGVGGLLAVGIAMPVAEAQRDYLLNQSYDTTERGEFELETYNDVRFPDASNDDTHNSKHQVELEYGLTDHLQVAYYEVYTWNRANDWERDALKLEAKLRFVEAGQWPVDLALYTEYKNPNGHRRDHSDVLENKVIVGKTLGRWNLIGNFVFEKALNNGSPWEYEYTAGVSCAVSPRVRLGLEVQQSLGNSKDFHFDASEPFLLIPSVAWSVTPHVQVIAGPAFGLTRASDDFQLRSIVEVEF